jgi:hypothetical protein
MLSRALFEQQVAGLLSVGERSQWTIHGTSYPRVDVEFSGYGRTPLRVMLNCEEWDSLPPSVELCNSAGERLKQLPPQHHGIFNAGPHPITGFPFVCTRGYKEYHTHSSHLNDRWEDLRSTSGHSLGELVIRLWYAWRETWT